MNTHLRQQVENFRRQLRQKRTHLDIIRWIIIGTSKHIMACFSASQTQCGALLSILCVLVRAVFRHMTSFFADEALLTLQKELRDI